MRVLVACNESAGDYIRGYVKSLRNNGLEVDVGISPFWVASGDYDIVHLHWPEALFNWQKPSWGDISTLLNVTLPQWARKSKIVITCHNDRSHLRNILEWECLYSNIYRFADGIVHLGKYSLDEFSKGLTNVEVKQVVIPLPTLEVYGKPIPMILAKKALGIPLSKKVLLSFGRFRHQEERAFFFDAFCRFLKKDRNRMVWAPSFGSMPPRLSRKCITKWVGWEIKHRPLLLSGRVRLENQHVPGENVSALMSAADAVIIQRLDTLNSGVIPVAYQYGKAVTGPSCGNIGEILHNTGNPMFDSGSVESCVDALEQTLHQAHDLGHANQQYSFEHWSPKKVGLLHKRMFEQLVTF